MSAWITDRVPTREDAGYDTGGQVWMQDPSGYRFTVHYDNIRTIGTPWQPITYPEPYVKPKVWAVRKSYSGRGYLEKNGTHVIGLSPFTEPEQLAIEDALNRLEEGV